MHQVLAAIHWASVGHQTQKRKVDGTPYVAHPLAVGLILQTITTDENIISAGILHDLLEDTAIDQSVILEHFPAEVLDYVKDVTEDKSITDWRERKQRYIDGVKTARYPVKLISAADKYHNLYTLSGDLAREGAAIWGCFKRGKAEQQWYYQTLYDIYRADPQLQSLKMVADMSVFIQVVFQDASAFASPV